MSNLRPLISLSLLIALLDQALKWIVASSFQLGESLQVIPGFFDLTLVHNTGGAFGLLSRKTFVFIALSIVTIFLLLWYYRHYSKKMPWVVWPVGLVLGGALGNLLDRIRLGYVVDFLDFYAGAWHWPAFNLADSAICVGLGILAFAIGKGE